MRVVLFTSEEPLYMPAYVERVLANHADAVEAVVIAPFPGSTLEQARSQFRMLGPRASAYFGTRHLRGRLLDALPGGLDRQLTGRYHSVRAVAAAHDVPVVTAPDVTAESFVDRIREIAPDLLLSVVCGQLLGSELLSIPDRSINVHGSKLPARRGRATAFWMLHDGVTEGGVTAHDMTTEFDAGPIVTRRTFRIDDADTLETVYAKVAHHGGELAAEVLHRYPELPTRPNPTTDEDYRSMPTGADRRRFRRRGNEFF